MNCASIVDGDVDDRSFDAEKGGVSTSVAGAASENVRFEELRFRIALSWMRAQSGR